MRELFAQGDLLLERVEELQPSGSFAPANEDGSYLLAEGELTGHSHCIHGRVTMFRDDGLARDIPGGLYIGHVKIEGPMARIQHQEHAPLTLPKGTYRVRRQRELEPKDARVVAD
jgi:hypothetical protein